MKHSIVFSAVLTLTIALAGCSSNSGKFYQHDGPPMVDPIFSASSAKPRVESFRPASLRPYTVMGQRFVPVTADIPMEQTGIGSWYGRQFHGNKTAIGETYDMHAMTAAHPTMPLPSYARVTNLENGRSVVVRVNDRGPFLNNRIIDLSYAAATELGYSKKGTARVRVRRITNAEIAGGTWINPETTRPIVQPVKNQYVQPAPVVTAPSYGWSVQTGFFTDADNAQRFAAHTEAILSSNGSNQPVRIIKDQNGYRVLLGKELDTNTAREQTRIARDLLGIEAFIIQR